MAVFVLSLVVQQWLPQFLVPIMQLPEKEIAHHGCQQASQHSHHKCLDNSLGCLASLFTCVYCIL